MHVSMSLGIASVHQSLNILGSMASKRAGSKDTYRSVIAEAVEQVFMIFPIYEDTKLIIDKDIKMKWQDINDTFSRTFEEDLEDRRVYVNIHKSVSWPSSENCVILASSSLGMLHVIPQVCFGFN